MIAQVQRRRRWSPEEKRAVPEEAEQPGNFLQGLEQVAVNAGDEW